MAMDQLLFVDTNIWLDFYRGRNEAALGLLDHLESVSAKLIVTGQLQDEYRRNRQLALVEGINILKRADNVARPGIISEKKAVEMLNKNIKAANERVAALKKSLKNALEKPAQFDPVYKVCQRIFQKADALTLSSGHEMERTIRRLAYRRFMLGNPPRKRNDISLGDAINWEWIIYCANAQKADIVIVTRDGDFGCTVDDVSYINDQLRHEFSKRVSQKRKLTLHHKLSEALKLFKVPVTKAEEDEEAAIVKAEQTESQPVQKRITLEDLLD